MSPFTSTRAEKARAIGELVLATNIWGFGFVTTIWALEGMGPVWLTTLRFAIGILPALPFLIFLRSARAAATLPSLWAAFLPGLFLSLTLVLQTWGLRYTTATKSGFITTLYVVFIPVIERWVLGRRLTGIQFACVFVALFGTGLIAELYGENGLGALGADGLNFGDLLTLLCAIAATFHILSIGRYGKKIGSAIVFNTFQSFWAGILPLGIALAFEPKPHDFFATKPLAGFLFLALASTFIAFMLQIRAQRHLSASVASMVFLLESPFAAGYAYLLLGERLNSWQWAGAALILIAVTLSSLEETRKQPLTPAVTAPHPPV